MEAVAKQKARDVLDLMLGTDIVCAVETALGSAGVRALYQPAFETVCGQGRADVAQVLLASESVNAATVVTAQGVTGTLLQHAVLNDNSDVVRVLLADASVEASINEDFVRGSVVVGGINAPLLLAAGLGHVGCLQALLECAHVTSTFMGMPIHVNARATCRIGRLRHSGLRHAWGTCSVCAPFWRRTALT